MADTLPDPPVPADADLTPLLLMPAPDLKAVIMDAYFAGCFTQADAEDLIVFYGLKHG